MSSNDILNSQGTISFKIRELDDDSKFKKSLEEIKTNLNSKGITVKPKNVSTKKKL